MNKHLSLIPFVMASLAILVSSCQKEEGTVTLGAEIKNSVYVDQKVYISDHTPCWHNGDQVNINGSVYSIVAASGASAQIPEVTRHDTYRAIFPASIVNGSNISNNSNVSITLPSVQYFQMVGNHQRVDVPMGAYMTSGSTLHFYNLCSVVRVTVSNSLNTDLSLSSIMLHAQQARLSGSGTAVVNGSASNSITMASSSSISSHQVSLVFTEDSPATVDALGSSSFDIVVPAFTTDNIGITVNTSDGQYFALTKSNVGLAHNTITTVTANVTELSQYPSSAELVSGSVLNSLIPSSANTVEFECNAPWIISGTLLSTTNSAVPIYGHLEGTTWRISTSAQTINANSNCSQMFKNKQNLSSVILDGLNTSNVTNMSSMFEGCPNLSSPNLSNFNTSNVTNMSSMFEGCTHLSSPNLSSFNTSNVTNMSSMFKGCGISNLNLSNFNTSNVTNMSSMFEGCGIPSLDLSSFNTSNVTNMNYMFRGCAIVNLNLSNFNNSNVTNLSSMFEGCSALVTLNLSNFNFSNVTNMSSMFEGCSALANLNLTNFNTSSVTNMSSMFKGCTRLDSLNLASFNTSSVINMSSMFEGCTRLDSLNLSNFNTSHVTNMSKMFKNCFVGGNDDYYHFTELNLSNFNTTSVTDMSEMFAGCARMVSDEDAGDAWAIGGIRTLNISSFNTSNVTNMSGMFMGCYALNNLNISSFNTQNVTNMSYMFYHISYRDDYGSYGINLLNLSNFNTSNVTDMSYMFAACPAFTSLNLSNFNTSNVTNMSNMFAGCEGLTRLHLPNSNTENVTNMNNMFNSCSSMTSLNLSHFDMSSVVSKTWMCLGLATTSGACTIICPLSVQTAMQSGTGLATSGVTFTWVRP